MTWKPIAIVLVLSILLPLGLAPPAAAASTVEGESGSPLKPSCLEGQAMGPTSDPSASGGALMFFSSLGCTAAYALDGTPVALRFRMGGHGGTLCGQFLLSGAFEGRSGIACAGPSDWVTVPVIGAGAGTGPVFVTWVPDWPLSERYWTDAHLDWIELA